MCRSAQGREGCSHPIPGLGLSVCVCGASHNLHVIKAQGKQILSRDLSCSRESVHGELGRGCNDENKSVCVNNKGKMMMRLISKALPFKRKGIARITRQESWQWLNCLALPLFGSCSSSLLQLTKKLLDAVKSLTDKDCLNPAFLLNLINVSDLSFLPSGL